MKKTIMLFIVLALTGCSVSAATSQKEKLPFIFVQDTTLYLELGDENTVFPLEEIFSGNSDKTLFDAAIINYDEINRNALGTYPLRVSFTEESNINKNMYVDVRVRDTTAPALEVKNVMITEGDSADINSFIVSNDDKQTTELSFTTEVDLVSVGSRDYVIASVDASGNRTEKSVNITVEAKPIINNWTPSNNGGGSSWTPPANSGGGGGGGTTPTPTPAPVTPYVVGEFNCVGSWASCIQQAKSNAPQFSTYSVNPAKMSDGTDSTTHFLIVYN